MNRTLWNALRLVTTLLLLGWVVSRMDLSETAARVQAFDPNYIPPVLGAIAAGSLLSVLKWSLILRTTGLSCRFGSLYRIFWIGTFFNNFLPGRTGGDLVRAYAISRRGSRKGEAAFSVVLDRFFSLFALAVISLIALFTTDDDRLAPVLDLVLWAAGAGAILFAAASLSGRLGDGTGRLGRLILRPLATSLRAILRRPFILLGIIGLSLLFQASVVLYGYLIARAIGIDLPLAPFFALIPVAALVSAIPVSINGFGVREASYGVLFAHVGLAVTDAVSMSLVSILCAMAASLVGAIFYLAGPLASHPVPTVPANASEPSS